MSNIDLISDTELEAIWRWRVLGLCWKPNSRSANVAQKVVTMTKITVPLQSTALREASYDDATQTLNIAFTDGRTYTYEGVPDTVFNELRNARSPGSYWHANIKDAY